MRSFKVEVKIVVFNHATQQSKKEYEQKIADLLNSSWVIESVTSGGEHTVWMFTRSL